MEDLEKQTFIYPPMLLPFLKDKLDFTKENNLVQSLIQQNFNLKNEAIYESYIQKFGQVLCSMFTKLKQKMIQGIKVNEYIIF